MSECWNKDDATLNASLCGRFLLLGVVHHVRPQRHHGRVSHHQRPGLQVKQRHCSDGSTQKTNIPPVSYWRKTTVRVFTTALLALTGTCTTRAAWRPPATSRSPCPPPSCRSCPPSSRRTSSSLTVSGIIHTEAPPPSPGVEFCRGEKANGKTSDQSKRCWHVDAPLTSPQICSSHLLSINRLSVICSLPLQARSQLTEQFFKSINQCLSILHLSNIKCNLRCFSK